MNPRTMEVIVDARRTYRSDPQTFESVINKLKKGNKVIAAAADMLLEKAKGEDNGV
ncbi:MAG: hypothetical protein OI715_00085 (plasmid) [Candidatus Methanoperedens sp.]|nr:MAG: hypothetical protein OI715_00085 [Candidatus Methanoperedens sp.]